MKFRRQIDCHIADKIIGSRAWDMLLMASAQKVQFCTVHEAMKFRGGKIEIEENASQQVAIQIAPNSVRISRWAIAEFERMREMGVP
jgi:hypothetical protein